MSLTGIVRILPLLTLLALPLEAAHITDKLLAGFYSQPNLDGAPARVLTSGTPLEVLEKGEAFSKVRLGDSSEGWVENQFITEEKPARVMLLELQVKNNQLQRELRKAKRQSTTPPQTTGETLEIEELKLQLAEARGLIETLNKQTKATERNPATTSPAQAVEIEALKAALAQSNSALKDAKNLPQIAPDSTLLAENKRLKARIKNAASALGAESITNPTAVHAKTSHNLKPWHLALVGLALMGSFVGGVAYKNHRLARRYGGFRV